MADFLNATKRPVYYKIGTKGGKPRLIKAPFDFIILDGEQFIATDGFAGALEKELDPILTGTAGDDTEAAYQNRLSDNGWVDEFIFVEPHEMGDAQFDSWKSCHAFGIL